MWIARHDRTKKSDPYTQESRAGRNRMRAQAVSLSQAPSLLSRCHWQLAGALRPDSLARAAVLRGMREAGVDTRTALGRACQTKVMFTGRERKATDLGSLSASLLAPRGDTTSAAVGWAATTPLQEACSPRNLMASPPPPGMLATVAALLEAGAPPLPPGIGSGWL